MPKKLLILILVLLAVFNVFPGVSNAQFKADIKIPILMYHEINNTLYKGRLEGLVVKTSEFEKQMKFLMESGYTPIEFKDIPNAYSFKKPIIITFDDGYKNNYTNAFPILKKYNIKSTIFVIGADVDKKKNHATSVELKNMFDSGLVSLQNHTWTHCDMPTLSKDNLKIEIEKCNSLIENITNEKPYVLCYPFGHYDEKVTSVCENFMEYCVTTQPGKYSTIQNHYTMNRVRISRDTSINEFKNLFC